jgi:hypothetical protein
MVQNTRKVTEIASVCDEKEFTGELFKRRENLRFLLKKLHCGKNILLC